MSSVILQIVYHLNNKRILPMRDEDYFSLYAICVCNCKKAISQLSITNTVRRFQMEIVQGKRDIRITINLVENCIFMRVEVNHLIFIACPHQQSSQESLYDWSLLCFILLWL